MATATESKAAQLANQFHQVFKKASEVANVEKTKLEAEHEKLTEQRNEIDKKLKEIDKQLDQLDSDVAVALKIAAKDAGVSLSFDGSKRRGSGGNGATRHRMTKEESERYTSMMTKALPNKSGKFVGVSELARSCKLEVSQARTLLQKLKTKKQAETNGIRGSGGGWRRA